MQCVADIGPLMMTSFAALFGVSHSDLKSVGDFIRNARQRDAWVTSRHQRRWLVMGQALLAWKQTARTSALTNNVELWDMLNAKCDLVDRLLEATNAQECRSGASLNHTRSQLMQSQIIVVQQNCLCLLSVCVLTAVRM